MVDTRLGSLKVAVLCSACICRPSASSSLDKIEDLPAAKAERFGQQFVHTIVEFCQKHDLPVDQFPKLVNSSQVSSKGLMLIIIMMVMIITMILFLGGLSM